MKLAYSWIILDRPIPRQYLLSQYLKPPIKKPLNEMLPHESLNSTVQVQTLESPLIPIIMAYRIDSGEEYEIDLDVSIQKYRLSVVEKRREGKSHLYVLIKVESNECYNRTLELIMYIKYGMPDTYEMGQFIKEQNVEKFIRTLGSREGSLYSVFTYERIKKEIVIEEPLDVKYKIGAGYVLFSIQNKEEEEDEDIMMTSLKSSQNSRDKYIVVESFELRNWLCTGRDQEHFRRLNLKQPSQRFSLKAGEMYNLLIVVETARKSIEVPYLLRWRWNYCEEVFGINKYISFEPLPH